MQSLGVLIRAGCRDWRSLARSIRAFTADVIKLDAAVRAVMATRTEWTGTASDLLGVLAEAAGERVARSKTWPDSPRALAGRLRRAATFLRKVGIEVAFWREGRARTRTIRITAAPESGGKRPSARSTSSAILPKVNGGNDFAADSSRTVADAADGRADGTGPVLQGPSAPTH
jgi:hypothetical protein